MAAALIYGVLAAAVAVPLIRGYRAADGKRVSAQHDALDEYNRTRGRRY